ncbi:hypothetical protein KEJ39_02610 [Candidatus Bathyarchaeota archaeon]|nr:hypothetical protein [Candidatus Bathyarchaeota archaeon]
MRFELQSGRALLVSGPASLMVEKGSAEILGAPLHPKHGVVIKKEKQLPIETVEDSVLEARLGERASYLEIDGTTIPESWYAAVEAFKSLGRGRAFVLGSADTGKSTFCTFLTNHMIKAGAEVSVVDADIGQSDLGPPGTVGLSIIKRPMTALEYAGVYRMAFVGETSPSPVTERVIESIVKVADRAPEDIPMVINTDGWITDGDAVTFKVRMIRRLMPDLIIGLAERDELDEILDATTVPSVKIQVPKYVKARGREERRRLREYGYRRYLRGAVHKNIFLERVKIDGLLKARCKGKELLGFLDSDGLLLGIGILESLIRRRKILRAYTNVSSREVAEIDCGRIRLSCRGEELD